MNSTTASSDDPVDYMDFLEFPMNPCSVESIPIPVNLQPNSRGAGNGEEAYDGSVLDVIPTRGCQNCTGRKVWPVMVGCYELQEDQVTRKGYLDLYSITVPTNTEKDDGTGSIKFGTPHHVLGNEAQQSSSSLTATSGILDGKWYIPRLESTEASTSSCVTVTCGGDGNPMYFASAHSSGEIMIHSITIDHDYETSSDEVCISPSSPASTVTAFQTELVGKSSTTAPIRDDDGDDDNLHSPSSSHPGLCLSLNWDRPTAIISEDTNISESAISSLSLSSRIISSYSKGIVKVHNILFPGGNQSISANNNDNTAVKFVEEYSWLGHTMFQNHPSEVWTACFVPTTSSSTGQNNNLVMTGGDEGNLKVWDLRCIDNSSDVTCRPNPVQVIKDFNAGVTVLSPHPRLDYIVACGSYDETIAIYDMRYFHSQTPSKLKSPLLCHSDSLGGGMWRMKWHPYNDDCLLLAAMHGGCRVVSVNGLLGHLSNMNESTVEEELASSMMNISVKKEFTRHKSMAYGADWLVVDYDGAANKRSKASNTGSIHKGVSNSNSYYEAAASCSFYDRALYLWDVNIRKAEHHIF